VASAQDFEFESQPAGFALTQVERSSLQATHSDDQRIYLTQRSVLEGTPALSEQWRLFESRDDLIRQAASARAASVIIAIESNKHVEQLARQLYDLREQCGVVLKIIVREIEPCLRYRDERLLVSCGANIVVPFGAQLAHFFSVIDSVQGQIWRHSRASDVTALFERLRPPDERGLLSPQAFITIIDQIFASASGEVSHQLLQLQPHKGLNIEQCLNQISLRRFGDIACVLDGAFYLFLFACRSDGLESALGNVCRLPWRDLFNDIRFFAGAEDLPRRAFIAAGPQPVTYQLAATHTDNESAPSRSAYMPQRITLPITDHCS
jgi:cellulose biosynthesis protein BcsE